MKGQALRLCSDMLSLALTAQFLSGCCTLSGYVIGSAIDANAEYTLDTSDVLPPGEIQTLSEGDSIEVLFREGKRLRCLYEKTELQNVPPPMQEHVRHVLTQPDGQRFPSPGDTVMISLSVGRRTAGYDTAEVICLGAQEQEDEFRIPVSEIDSLWSREAGGAGTEELREALRLEMLPQACWRRQPLASRRIVVRSAEGTNSYPLESVEAVWRLEEPRAKVYGALIGVGLDLAISAAVMASSMHGMLSQEGWSLSHLPDGSQDHW